MYSTYMFIISVPLSVENLAREQKSPGLFQLQCSELSIGFPIRFIEVDALIDRPSSLIAL